MMKLSPVPDFEARVACELGHVLLEAALLFRVLRFSVLPPRSFDLGLVAAAIFLKMRNVAL